MNYTYSAGTNWGKLTILRVYNAPDMIEGMDMHGNKHMYDRGSYTPLTWDLECLCGSKFSIEASKFPGRRKLNSCAECAEKIEAVMPVSRGSRERSERKRVVPIYMPLSVEDEAQKYADDNNLSFSKAVVVLIAGGLKHMTKTAKDQEEEAILLKQQPTSRKLKPWQKEK